MVVENSSDRGHGRCGQDSGCALLRIWSEARSFLISAYFFFSSSSSLFPSLGLGIEKIEKKRRTTRTRIIRRAQERKGNGSGNQWPQTTKLGIARAFDLLGWRETTKIPYQKAHGQTKPRNSMQSRGTKNQSTAHVLCRVLHVLLSNCRTIITAVIKLESCHDVRSIDACYAWG